MNFSDHVGERLHDLERRGLHRNPRHIASSQGPELLVGGRRVLGLCSNDYLGLAAHPQLASAARDAVHHFGTGAGSSRHIAGTLSPHLLAEELLARFLDQPAALLFGSGYTTNLGSVQATVGPGDAIFSDQLNHASLIDGCRLSRASVYVYRHRDAEHLRQLLTLHRSQHGAALIVTESLFSMDADEAPLSALSELARAHRTGLLVDEAHALGVLGPGGRGLCHEAGVRPDMLVGTLGKAFGTAGAFLAGSPEVVSLVANRARSYVFSTAPPPANAAVAAAAVPLVETADSQRRQLLGHAERLRHGLAALGYRVLPGRSQIVPCLVGDDREVMRLSADLLERGVFVHGIRSPTVPPGTARLRLTPTARHTREQIDAALDAFASLRPGRRD